MKLQWLPEPSSKGGWDNGTEWSGRDRFGDVLATVKEVTHPWEPTVWVGFTGSWERVATEFCKNSAILAVEKLIPEDDE